MANWGHSKVKELLLLMTLMTKLTSAFVGMVKVSGKINITQMLTLAVSNCTVPR